MHSPRMSRPHRTSQAFTLVELMVAIAIASVLAAIAIPIAADYQFRAKHVEIDLITPSIGTSVQACMLDNECTHSASLTPVSDWTDVGRSARPWPQSPGSAWEAVGWEPDGYLRGTYSFSSNLGIALVDGYIDVNEDGDYAFAQWTRSALAAGPSGLVVKKCYEGGIDTAAGWGPPCW